MMLSCQRATADTSESKSEFTNQSKLKARLYSLLTIQQAHAHSRHTSLIARHQIHRTRHPATHRQHRERAAHAHSRHTSLIARHQIHDTTSSHTLCTRNSLPAPGSARHHRAHPLTPQHMLPCPCALHASPAHQSSAESADPVGAPPCAIAILPRCMRSSGPHSNVIPLFAHAPPQSVESRTRIAPSHVAAKAGLRSGTNAPGSTKSKALGRSSGDPRTSMGESASA